MSSRVHIILSDEELEKLDFLCEKLSMNRSRLIRLLIIDADINPPVYVSNKEIIGLVNELDMNIKALVVSDKLQGDDVITVMSILESIKTVLKEDLM